MHDESPSAAAETWVTGVRAGAAVKYLGNGEIEGPAILFTGPDDPDVTGDFFDADTDLWLDDGGTKTFNALFDHGLDDRLGLMKVGRGPLEKREGSAWMRAKLNEREDYVKDIIALAEAGALGWSTASASHLVRRERAGKSWRIAEWPVIEVSLTHRPAEPRTFAVPLKSWAACRADGDAVDLEALNDALKALMQQPAGVRPFRDIPRVVVSAVEGFRDLSRKLAEGRAADGRPLGEAKRDAIRSVVDGVSPLIDDLRAVLESGKAAPATGPDADAAKARLRLLKIKNEMIRLRGRDHTGA